MTDTTHERSWTHEGRPKLSRGDTPPVDGPWTSEPDKVHWIDPETDLDCLAVRNGRGAWCGYVGLPPGHRLHGVGYDECVQPGECTHEWCYEHTPNAAVEVHGGLTFAGSCNESDKGEGHGICHVPLPGRPHDVWWLGFDAAQLGDLTPYDAALRAREGDHRGEDVYRDLDYIKAECASLARQLAAVAS
jgi:hypothetical protein